MAGEFPDIHSVQKEGARALPRVTLEEIKSSGVCALAEGGPVVGQRWKEGLCR